MRISDWSSDVCSSDLHAIDLLTAAGVQRVVVNTHHRADLIESFLTRHVSPVPAVSRECELLDTGGGVKKALPLLGDEPFFVTNADLIWEIGAERALHRMVEEIGRAHV